MSDTKKSRICDGCTLCCFTHGVERRTGVVTQPFSDCEHCAQGFGCSIYDNRPLSCREFRCAWLQGAGKEEERPDKVGFVITTRMTRQGETATMVVTTPARGSALEHAVSVRYARERIPLNRIYEDGTSQFVFTAGAQLTDKFKADAARNGNEIVFIETGDPP